MGYSPYFLMFEWEARIYVLGHAQMEKLTKPTPLCYQNQRRLKESLYHGIRGFKKDTTIKKGNDQRLHFHYLEPGDWVLLQNLGLKVKDKLENRWYDLLARIHRNNILPIGSFVRIPVLDNTKNMPKKPVPVIQSRIHIRRKQSTMDNNVQRDSNVNSLLWFWARMAS